MSEFVARTDMEWELVTWLRPKCHQGFVEVEKVVSGEGIKNIYHFLRETKPELIVNSALDAEIVAAGCVFRVDFQVENLVPRSDSATFCLFVPLLLFY